MTDYEITIDKSSGPNPYHLTALVTTSLYSTDPSIGSFTYKIDSIVGTSNGSPITGLGPDAGIFYQDYYTPLQLYNINYEVGSDSYVVNDEGHVYTEYVNGNAVNFPILVSSAQVMACFRAGTLIALDAARLSRVEDLKIGDIVRTAGGTCRPIVWLGHRTIQCTHYSRPESVHPIRIAAHAFGVNQPERDLYVSPGHCICVTVIEPVLIPASALVNGATVTQVEVEVVTYWHIELDRHDVLLAEGLPAESYRDVGNRSFFVDSRVVDLAAQPDGLSTIEAASDLTFTDCGPILDAVRIGLRARAVRAGWTMNEEPFAGLHVVADGVVVQPDRDGLTARFVLPASATDVWLVSDTSVPFDVGDNPDRRRLGVSLSSLSIDDGMGARHAVSLDDARLNVGFYALEMLECGQRRWTAGRAQLPRSLWETCRGSFFLRVDLTGPALPRWVAPRDERVRAEDATKSESAVSRSTACASPV